MPPPAVSTSQTGSRQAVGEGSDGAVMSPQFLFPSSSVQVPVNNYGYFLPTMDTKGLDSQIVLVHLFLLLLLFLMILHVLLQHFKACLYRQYSKTSYHLLTFRFGFAL